MSRPVGVTASAIVAILGSIFAVLLAVLSVASLFIETPQPQHPQFVIAGTAHTFHRTIAVMFGIPLAIGVWWLIQFNTQSTKAAFASPIAGPASPRPLSITIIAWASIVGGASCLFPILTRTPAFLFGAVFNGWTAGVIYAFFGAVSLYIGKGLLDLRERARVLAIGWFGFSFVHLSLIALVPSLRHRMLELQRGLEQNQPNPIPFDQGMMTNVILGFAAIVAASAIWFLVRDRGAFA